MKAAVSTLIFALTFTSFSRAQLPSSDSTVDFGLLHDDAAYHSFCDKGTDGPLNANGLPTPRACFVSPYHVSQNLRDPAPSILNGIIDGSGKAFVLFPNAEVTLKDLEIRVKFLSDTKTNKNDRDAGCVDVKVYRLPKRNIQVRETWCPKQFIPIIL